MDLATLGDIDALEIGEFEQFVSGRARGLDQLVEVGRQTTGDCLEQIAAASTRWA
jgi:hypothetical protein